MKKITIKPVWTIQGADGVALSPRLMRELGVTNGFRHVINTGRDGHQEVMHLHLHVMGGPRPWLKG